MKTAFPQTQGTCSIRLYSNIPFDNTYKNHSIISTKFTYNGVQLYNKPTSTYTPCEQFLDREDFTQGVNIPYYPRYDLTGEFNFNFSNGLVGNVTLELTPAQTNANYLRLKCGNDYYYYFITSISQDNFDTYTLSLELDVLMTYQEEFLEGIAGKPVFTRRKHCRRYYLTAPYCADLKTGDSAFAGVKPSYVQMVKNLHFSQSDMQNLEEVKWLYVCIEPDFFNHDYPTNGYLYTYKNKKFPLTMVAIPLLPESIDTHDLSGGITYRYRDANFDIVTNDIANKTLTDLERCIEKLINDGSVYSAKISPYPPFNITDGSSISFDDVNHKLVITAGYGDLKDTLATSGEPPIIYNIFEMTIGENKVAYSKGFDVSTTLGFLLNYGGLVVTEQNDIEFNYDTYNPSDLGIGVDSIPTITSNRIKDAKLFFQPFKKYVLNSQYTGDGYEFHPELIFSKYACNIAGKYFYCHTIASSYIGDNNFFTYISSLENVKAFENYKYEKIGLASNVNYSFPCGTNALDVFNSTQAQSFYQSKVASGITSGLTIAGGVITTGIGLFGSGISGGATAGLIAGGLGAIGGGVSSLVNTFKSTSAKIEDLKNAPDSINISGSNYITDSAIASNTNALPYIVVYNVADVIEQNADDYFYQYGYEVSRDTYFNTELYPTGYNANNYIDNNLFNRSIFNYIQIQEDITNKIDANIPLIIKQKLSSVFNDGITLWCFFGSSLYNNIIPTSQYYLDRWFMKNTLDNSEFRGSF